MTDVVKSKLKGRSKLTETYYKYQKQPPRGVLRKTCSESMQQIYRRTPMLNVTSIRLLCNFIEITLRHGCSPVNLLSIFRTRFTKNTSGLLLLKYGKRNSDLDKIIAKTNECVESIFSRKG